MIETPSRPRRMGGGAQPGRSPPRTGEQTGADGSSLGLVADPYEIVDHVPTACAEHGTGLGDAAPEGVVRRQVHDIPPITEHRLHRLHRLRCWCGHRTRAEAPVGVGARTSSSINGTRLWLHVAATPRLTAYHLHRSRGRVAVTEFGVLPDHRGTLVHDRLTLYDADDHARHALVEHPRRPGAPQSTTRTLLQRLAAHAEQVVLFARDWQPLDTTSDLLT